MYLFIIVIIIIRNFIHLLNLDDYYYDYLYVYLIMIISLFYPLLMDFIIYRISHHILIIYLFIITLIILTYLAHSNLLMIITLIHSPKNLYAHYLLLH